MNKALAIMVATLMVLSVFASGAMALENNTSITTLGTNDNTTPVSGAVQIRGPVYSGTDLTTIIANQGSNGALTMDANKFAAFFYDINNNVTTETLSIKQTTDTKDRTIGINSLVYSTTIAQTEYQYTKDADANTKGAWGSYNVLGFFAEKYIPLNANDASKLARLVLDTNDKYTLETGETLELGSGYTLTAKQVDVNGNKVWLELNLNGQPIADQIISTDTGDHTWSCDLDKIQGEDNVIVLKVHVNQVFQGAETSIAQIDGLWLIDYANAIKINSDDAFGKLNNVALNGNNIAISNDDAFTLTKDADIEIGNGLFFKVAEDDTLRFYAYKQETKAGTYALRGTVATGAYTWNASNFAGFFYDLKKDVSTESLTITAVDNRVIPESGLVYSTTITNIDYQYKPDTAAASAWTTYPVLGFMAKEYVPLEANDASKLAKLVIDSDDKYSLSAGSDLELGEGYSLQVKQVDINGNKVWIELDLNGDRVDDAIVDTAAGDHTWTSKLTVLGQQDIPVFKVHITQVFQGAEDSVAQIDGLWLIDYAKAVTIDTTNEFGKLNDVSINGATITIDNKDTFTLTTNTDKLDINGQGMYFKVADDDQNLRFYPYIEESVGNGTTVTTTTSPTVSEPIAPVTTPVTPEVNNTTAPIIETPTPVVETPVVETPVVETPVANNTTDEPSSIPGFGAIPAIGGLLIIVYLVRKNR